jgi:hypothetical protein
MAKHVVEAETPGGRRVPSVTVLVYDEDTNVADGSEDSGFSDSDLSDIYSDQDMTQSIAQTTSPLKTDNNGQATFFMPSGSQVAIKLSRDGFNTTWLRYVDITGTDPL